MYLFRNEFEFYTGITFPNQIYCAECFQMEMDACDSVIKGEDYSTDKVKEDIIENFEKRTGKNLIKEMEKYGISLDKELKKLKVKKEKFVKEREALYKKELESEIFHENKAILEDEDLKKEQASKHKSNLKKKSTPTKKQ